MNAPEGMFGRGKRAMPGDVLLPEEEQGLNGEIPLTAEEQKAEATTKLRDACEARAFNFAIIPAKPIPRLTIKGNVVSTAGNLTNIIAQSKACKSTLQEAMMAAIISADAGTASDCDCLGISATAPKGMHVLHFDTEQSLFDHDALMRRAIRRARADECPMWLHSYCLTGFAIPDCRRIVMMKMEDMTAIGGTFAVFIDGVGDLAVNVNDPEECNPLVAELHAAAIQHNCSIISNIHENPGQDFGKGRGHLGSQLERKAESNLRLKKNGDTITLFSEKMRRGSILEKEGPTFSWDNTAMMHLSCANKGSPKEMAKLEKLKAMVEEVNTHSGKTVLRYSEVTKILIEVAHISADHASTRFTEFKKAGLIAQDMVGGWSRTPSQG